MNAAATMPRSSVPDGLASLGYRLLAVAIICVLLATTTDAFLTQANILNVLRQAALLFLIASGLTLVILTAGLDLSVGANLGMAACVVATVLKSTGSPVLGMLTGIACGLAVGLGNGILIAWMRIPPFIATYGMLWMLHGLSYYYMKGETVYGFPPGFREIGSGYWFGLPVPIYLMGVFLLIGWLFTQRTTWGQEIYAIGANPVAARLSGIPVKRRIVLVYTVSGGMAGLAALVYLARLNSAEADIGEPLLLPAIAACLIGGTSLFGGVGTVFGTLVGAVILTLVLNGMNLLQVNSNWQPFVTGVIVLAGVWIDMATRGRSTERS
jgi:ribose transport system permease protein